MDISSSVSRNNIVFEKKKTCSCASYLFDHPLAMYMGDSAEGGFLRLGCGGLATVDVGIQGYFLLDI